MLLIYEIPKCKQQHMIFPPWMRSVTERVFRSFLSAFGNFEFPAKSRCNKDGDEKT